MFLTMLKVALKREIAFRFDLLMELLWPLALMGISFAVWHTIAAGKFNVFGYVVAVWLTWFFINDEVANLVADKIMSGQVFFDLIRPMDFYLYNFLQVLADQLAYFLLVSPFFVSLFILAKFNFFVLVSYFFTFLISFNLYYLIGLTSVFTTHIYGTKEIIESISFVLGGLFFPIDLLPPLLRKIAEFLPFYYMYYAPFVAISSPAILLKQLVVWICIFLFTFCFQQVVVRKICVVGI